MLMETCAWAFGIRVRDASTVAAQSKTFNPRIENLSLRCLRFQEQPWIPQGAVFLLSQLLAEIKVY